MGRRGTGQGLAAALFTDIIGSTEIASELAQVGADPICLAAGLGSLWIGDENGDVHRVDPLTFESEVVYRAGGPVRAVIPDEERGVVWLDVGSNST